MTADGSSGDFDAADVVTPAEISAARGRIEDVVHETPLDRSTTFARRSGAATVGLKLENMQRTGSFKIRGALNALHQRSPADRDQGVITASAGNHAQGLALASAQLDVDATIVVPEITPAAKIAATRGYGAEVVVEGEIYEESYEHARMLAAEKDLTFVHPFDDDAVIAGQGTIGLELLEQLPELDTVLVAIGGGGLISGIATALKAHDPTIGVIGVQPEGAAHAPPSLQKGEIHRLDDVDTIADGIADLRMLDRTFAVVNEHVDNVVTVSDNSISVAVTLLAERAKTVVEPAGAAPVAALLSDDLDVDGDHVCCVISGGNVDLSTHAELTQTGLMHLGRRVSVRLALDQWPTSLGRLTDLTLEHGATLADVSRDSRTATDPPNRVPATIHLEGSGPDHLATVIEALREQDEIAVLEHSPDLTSMTPE